MATDGEKWSISWYSGFLFLVIASPFLYRQVNTLTESILGVSTANDGCPNGVGLLLHAFVFVLVTRWSMK